MGEEVGGAIPAVAASRRHMVCFSFIFMFQFWFRLLRREWPETRSGRLPGRPRQGRAGAPGSLSPLKVGKLEHVQSSTTQDSMPP